MTFTHLTRNIAIKHISTGFEMTSSLSYFITFLFFFTQAVGNLNLCFYNFGNQIYINKK